MSKINDILIALRKSDAAQYTNEYEGHDTLHAGEAKAQLLAELEKLEVIDQYKGEDLVSLDHIRRLFEEVKK